VASRYRHARHGGQHRRFAQTGRSCRAALHWTHEPQRSAVTAGQVGQVFGIALDDANPPNVYLTATSVFGLHRNAANTDWMAGMWGPDGGPGTIWKLNAADNYRPEVFARIALDGRPNSGAALGNIAYDRWNKQLYVSDLETGMIHRLRASDGADLGHYDHGKEGRPSFLDAQTGASQSLPPVAFDPASRRALRPTARAGLRPHTIVLELRRLPAPVWGGRAALSRRRRGAPLLFRLGQPGLRQCRLRRGGRRPAQFGLVGAHRPRRRV
jgi:hypothetical protein